MRSFMLGSVLEPEVRTISTKKGDRDVLTLAILSGRTSVQFDVWEDDRNYRKFAEFSNGDYVCAIVSDGLDDRGRIKHYLNDMALCSSELREDFCALFN